MKGSSIRSTARELASNEFSNNLALAEHFSNLVGTRFFIGPLDEHAAMIELRAYCKRTDNALLFECDDGFYLVYP